MTTWVTATSCWVIIELSIKTLKEGQNHRIDHSLRELYVKTSLAHRVLEPILKLGETLGPPLCASQTLREFRI